MTSFFKKACKAGFILSLSFYSFGIAKEGFIKTYGYGMTYGGGVINTVPSDPVDGYVFSGWGSSTVNNPGRWKRVLGKVNKIGECVLYKTELTSDNREDHQYRIIQFKDGYAVTTDDKIIKLNTNLVDVGSINISNSYSLSNTSDGGIIGCTNVGTIFKINSNFQIDATFNSIGYLNLNEGWLSHVFEAKDGSFIATVANAHPMDWKPGSSSNGTVIKVSSDGSTVNKYNYSYFLQKNAALTYGVQTADGGFAFTGHADGNRAIFIKTASDLGSIEKCFTLPEYYGDKRIGFGFGIAERPYGFLLATAGQLNGQEDFQYVRVSDEGRIIASPEHVGGNGGEPGC